MSRSTVFPQNSLFSPPGPLVQKHIHGEQLIIIQRTGTTHSYTHTLSAGKRHYLALFSHAFTLHYNNLMSGHTHRHSRNFRFFTPEIAFNPPGRLASHRAAKPDRRLATV